MTATPRYQKTQRREFFAHHMLLHAADLQIQEAAGELKSRFNRCLAAMVMTSLSTEALANAVGSRTVNDWTPVERLSPLEKLNRLVQDLKIDRDANKEPWSTLGYLSGFRNDIAHPKPELIEEQQYLPQHALDKKLFDAPLSMLEREISIGNARRCLKAVQDLKGILVDAMPAEERFGMYTDMWPGNTGLPE